MSALPDAIARFRAYKRALGRRYDTEEKQLQLVERALRRQGVTEVPAITPDVLDRFWRAGAGRGRAAITSSSACSVGCSPGWSSRGS